MKKAFITGGAGFIGSNLTARLLHDGWEVTILDNLFLGKREFLADYFENKNFSFIEDDLLELDKLKTHMSDHDVIFHLAANSDIGYGTQYTDWDLKQGTLVTYNVLEAMRTNNIKEIIFASSSAIYGLASENPTQENYGPLFPISLYGASKLACEGLISTFSNNFSIKAWLFRFGNIVGRNATHGAIYDFIHKLKKNNNELKILGNGLQSKPYLHVSDCVDGILYGYHNSPDNLNYFNLATDGGTSVTDIANTVVESMNLNDVDFKYTGTEGGWVGDVPFVRLDPSKLSQLGWSAKYTSDEAVKHAVNELVEQL
jgi:UDP-glucose 4-epimerase